MSKFYSCNLIVILHSTIQIFLAYCVIALYFTHSTKEMFMRAAYRLSLKDAIFVNINIMIGAGIFVNTIPLSERIGIFSPLSYIAVGILLLPLIFSMMKLIEYYPEGGFYTYVSSELSPRFGFAAAWSYFIGKMASATLVLSFSTRLFQEIIPLFKEINQPIVYGIILCLILTINNMGMRLGSSLQKMLVYAKFIPIVIVILIGLLYWNTIKFSVIQPTMQELIETIPMVLYAASGFETACILSLTIQDPTNNASRAILFSYISVLSIAAIYQLFAYILFTQSSLKISEYTQFFSTIARSVPFTTIIPTIQLILILGLAYSALGSAFGIFYGNIWNFFTLAKQKYIPGYKYFTKLNRFGIPSWCIVAEGLISLFFFFIASGNYLLLQQCSALALSFTFTTSIIALYKRRSREEKSTLLPILGIINCLIFVNTSLYSLIKTNTHSFILFACLFLFGIAMFLLSEWINNKHN